MSRIGNKVITIPAGVNVTLKESHISVKGPKGQLDFAFDPCMKVTVEGNTIKIVRPSDDIFHKALHGTTRAIINNMVVGVTNQFAKSLEIQGVGFRAQLIGKTLQINAGFSHLVDLQIPEGIKVEVPTPTDVNLTGCDKQAIGQFAAEIRAVREPEPYKGKGIRYKGEFVRRKEGKKAK
jgi:large subunit ribosomal protein L6